MKPTIRNWSYVCAGLLAFSFVVLIAQDKSFHYFIGSLIGILFIWLGAWITTSYFMDYVREPSKIKPNDFFDYMRLSHDWSQISSGIGIVGLGVAIAGISLVV